MLKEFTCIICPNGCAIQAQLLENNEIGEISGQMCPRGIEYVKQELLDPKRNIATSIVVENGELPLVSVRLSGAIPKNRIFDVVAEINKQKVCAPTKIGQVVIKNVLDLGADVIITKEIAKI
ncbi:MAG: DUF1667 domain-containing protein [Clostridia bacterium]